jgi:hypothetical protein
MESRKAILLAAQPKPWTAEAYDIMRTVQPCKGASRQQHVADMVLAPARCMPFQHALQLFIISDCLQAMRRALHAVLNIVLVPDV